MPWGGARTCEKRARAVKARADIEAVQKVQKGTGEIVSLQNSSEVQQLLIEFVQADADAATSAKAQYRIESMRRRT